MAIDTFSPNRNYVLPATGNDVNTWGPLLNGNFSAIDSNISALLTISTTGGTTTLTAGQAANLFYNVNGALTSNAIVVFPAVIQTFFMATNNTTGAFTLTIQNANTGTTQTLAQGAFALFYSDGTNIFLVSQNVPASVMVPPVLITTAATTLTVAQSGFLIEMQGASTYVVTLPAAATSTGVKYLFFANGAARTLAAAGGLFGGPNGNSTASLSLPNGSSIFVVSDGFAWVATGLMPNPAYALVAGSIGQTFSVAPATTSTMAPQWGQEFGGNNATWHDVTGSRSFNFNFQNLNGKPIMVKVTFQSTSLGSAVTASSIVSGVVLSVVGAPGVPGQSPSAGDTFIVPPNAIYSVTGAGPISLIKWVEYF